MEHLTQMERAYRAIKKAIQSGGYAKGERLQQLKLSDELNLGRTPIREALKILERDGYVELTVGMGAYVRGFTEEDILEIYEVREGLEPIAARLAAQRAERSQISAMKRAIERMEELADSNSLDIIALHQAEADFHCMIFLASHNKRLIAYAETAHLDTYWFLDETLMEKVDPAFEQAIEEHRKIYENIRNGLYEEAELSTLKHIRAGKKILEKNQH